MGSNPKSITGGTFAPTDETFKITVKPAGVRFLSRGVQPPSSIYVEAEDDLAVSVASSVANETVTFNYRLLRFNSEIIEGQFTVSPASNRSVKKYSESLAEGFLLSMSCQAAAATTRGQTFVRVALTSPAFGGNLPSYMVMADYVTNAMAPAHPNGRVLAPTEGPGNIYQVNGAVPGVGLNGLVTVPANARWKVKAIIQNLTIANAGVARNVFAIVAGPLGNAFEGNAYAQGAINTVTTFCASNAVSNSVIIPTVIGVPLPADLIVLAGTNVELFCLNINAADQWSATSVLVEEWLDNV